MIAPEEMPGHDRLKGKVVLVVGAGSIAPGWGIGKACSVVYAREGARVCAVDISREAAEETARIITARGGEAVALTADVADRDSVASMVEACRTRFGRIDVLHNNVGIGEIGGPVELSEESWDRISDANVKGLFLTCKSVLPVMEAQGAGAIVTVSSVAAFRYPGYPHLAYGTTKAAAIQFTRMIALQYAARGIRANTVVPGLIDTPRIAHTVARAITSEGVDAARRLRDAQCPMGRMGTAWEVANAALFLASDEASYVTGAELVVDGGLSWKCT